VSVAEGLLSGAIAAGALCGGAADVVGMDDAAEENCGAAFCESASAGFFSAGAVWRTAPEAVRAETLGLPLPEASFVVATTGAGVAAAALESGITFGVEGTFLLAAVSAALLAIFSATVNPVSGALPVVAAIVAVVIGGRATGGAAVGGVGIESVEVSRAADALGLARSVTPFVVALIGAGVDLEVLAFGVTLGERDGTLLLAGVSAV